MKDRTMTFSLPSDHESEMKQTLKVVYDALTEKG